MNATQKPSTPLAEASTAVQLVTAKTLTNVLADNVGAYDRLKVEQEQRMTALLAELQGKQ